MNFIQSTRCLSLNTCACLFLSLSTVFIATPAHAVLLDFIDDLRDYDLEGNVQFHGYTLNDQYKLRVEQRDNWAVIRLDKSERAPGGPFLWFDPKTGEEASVIRFDDETPLAELRSEVIIPSAPNYLKNPGQHYRITINGLGVAPWYHRVFEASAANVLDAIFTEFNALYSYAYGIERDALFFGMVIATRVLNEAQHLPSEMPLGTIRSAAFQTRIQGPGMQRVEQPRLRRFAPVKQGGQFMNVMTEQNFDTRTFGSGSNTSQNIGSPTPADGPTETPRGKSFYNEEERDQGYDPGSQLRNFTSQEDRARRPGQAGKALTAPQFDYPAISASQMETVELMLGPIKSPMEVKMEQGRAGQSPTPPRRIPARRGR
jgi:hypothetical protein